MVLMPDGRVLSFGTKADGTQTGYFIYDVWDPAGGLNGGHTTLANPTGTDIFCSSSLVLPQGGKVFIAGGDNWTGTAHDQHGQQQQQPLRLHHPQRPAHEQPSLAPEQHEPGALVFEFHRAAQRRGLHTGWLRRHGLPGGPHDGGTFRLLTGAGTGSLDFMYPRNFIAPDGSVFGYDSNGKMYYVNTAGTGSITTDQSHSTSVAVQRAHRQRCERSHVPARPHPAVRRQLQRRGRDRYPGRRTGGDADRVHVVAAPTGQCHDPCRRQGAGHRRQSRLERHDQRQLQRRDLGPEHRGLDRRRQRRQSAPVPLDVRADAGRQRHGGGWRRARSAEQHQLRGLLPAVPVRRRRRIGDPTGHRFGAVGHRHRPDVSLDFASTRASAGWS